MGTAGQAAVRGVPELVRDDAQARCVEREAGHRTRGHASDERHRRRWRPGPAAGRPKNTPGPRDELTAALVARESFDVQRFDRKAIQAKVEEHVNGWRALLTKHVEDGRRLLREVLAAPGENASARRPQASVRLAGLWSDYRFEPHDIRGDLKFTFILKLNEQVKPLVWAPVLFKPVLTLLRCRL